MSCLAVFASSGCTYLPSFSIGVSSRVTVGYIIPQSVWAFAVQPGPPMISPLVPKPKVTEPKKRSSSFCSPVSLRMPGLKPYV